ncbi:MAG: hypothetical protein SFY69_03095 [Planctomycetota bacterium]|nr:hypothetical protein [Planctomycetota bacterium]
MASDPNQLVLLTTTRTEFEARAIAGALEAEGIATHVFAAAAQGIAWEGGIANAVKVMVRRDDAAVADEALHRARRASRAIDWSTVDVGLPEDETAARVADAPSAPSPWRWRVRIVGMVLLSSPLLLNMMGQGNALIALAAGAMLIVAAWNPPAREEPVVRRVGAPGRLAEARRG